MPRINYDTVFQLLLDAASINDRAEVMRPTGAKQYVLRHSLTVYGDKKGERPIEMNGCFLISPDGSINQIALDTKLKMNITAIDLYEWLCAEEIGDDNYIEDK